MLIFMLIYDKIQSMLNGRVTINAPDCKGGKYADKNADRTTIGKVCKGCHGERFV